MNVKTKEQFAKQFKELHPTLTLLSDYTNSSSPIKVKCNICGKIWNPRADTLKNIHCTTCNKINKYKQQVYEVLPNIQILSNFTTTHEHVKCRCLKCGYEWDTATISHLKQGHGCPQCAKNIKIDIPKANNILHKIHPTLNVIDIINVNNIKLKCTICGHIWNSGLNNVLKSKGCSVCSENQYSTDTYKKALHKINPNWELIGEYFPDKITVKCKLCKNIFEKDPYKLLENRQCSCISASSGEQFVRNYLTEHHIKFIPEYTIPNQTFKSRKFIRIDFYLPDLNIYIEYNGKQHYVPIEFFGGKIALDSQKSRDEELRLFCNLKNIKLIEIPYSLSFAEITTVLDDNLSQK